MRGAWRRVVERAAEGPVAFHGCAEAVRRLSLMYGTVGHDEGCGAACWQVSAREVGMLCSRVLHVG